uniref:ATP synthase subunit delta n=1 Tax=Candidatus Kentrum sp. TC TaxID=2126339 RepID=A0A450YVV8_9GAMM|nr:MAG: F-type H+-transporting ATPase subunit delta [Candidatus Kentron sp. TC]VFK49343.1 MAG: F-type H+-transporting ATPase subunit delta [Candidatus Kentron sp. TC]VFK53350.1 MAG: F-type H+-transporting ATPase subunit delta [Candidatus Kentron sp. TC]
MARKYTLARPYAFAIFKLAREEGKLDLWSEMLRFLALVTASSDVLKIIRDPRVPKFHLVTLMLELAEGKLSKTGENFVRVLGEAGRMGIIQEISELFEKELDSFKNRSRVKVISAYPLTSAYEEVIKVAMTKRLGREVLLSVVIDKSLIGGVVIRVGDVVIDISLRGRLTQFGLDLTIMAVSSHPGR